MPLLSLLLLEGAALAADGKAKPPKESAGDELFTNTTIRRLRLEISPKDIATLRKYRWRREAAADERVDVPATVREGDLVWTNVAVHLKGAAGSFRPVDFKPGLTLNFDKFAEGQRFHGLQKISLNNSVQDPAYISEKLCREIFLKAGVPVPRSDYAVVELNGRSFGLYVLAEGWNKQFLKRYFKNVKGNLYDGSFGKDINRELPVNTGEKPDDQAELKPLYALCTNRDVATRWTKLAELMDLDRFITLQALEVMMWDWDGYAMNRNNYRLFHDLETGRLVFLPHGLDQMFWSPEGPLVTGTKGTVARAVMQTPEGRRLFLERVAQLRTNLFTAEAMTKRVNELSERIRPAVAESGFAAAVQHSAWVKTLRDRITRRVASIDEQLAGVRRLLQLKPGASAKLTGWTAQTNAGSPVLSKTEEKPAALRISAGGKRSAGAWSTTVWLEEGTYRVTATIKTRAVVAAQEGARAGAGLRVWSGRKVTDGVHWDWFPYRESHDTETRGDLPPIEGSERLSGTTDWIEVTYDFELRQPIADLTISCELWADAGEAWFHLESLKITRTKQDVSASGLPR
jgi:hypothetical protein